VSSSFLGEFLTWGVGRGSLKRKRHPYRNTNRSAVQSSHSLGGALYRWLRTDSLMRSYSQGDPSVRYQRG
jgi:hypothetical protein